MNLKKFKILCLVLLIIMFLLIPSQVRATTSDVQLESISVASPKTGTYATGEKITIIAKYTGVVGGESNITIKFGSDGEKRPIKGSVKDNSITYEYTVNEKDSGKLSLCAISSYLKDIEGNSISNGSLPVLGGSEIIVNPITWTDATKCKLSIDDKYKLEMTGITEIESHQYYIFITNSTEEPKIILDKNGWVSNYDKMGLRDLYIGGYLEKSGDIYFWLCEQQKNYDTGKYEQKFIIAGKKIEREQRKLGYRLYVTLDDNSSIITINEPHDSNNVRKAKLKIGQVTDKSILVSLKNKEENSLNKLLSYAKEAKSIYTGTLPVGTSQFSTDGMNLIENNYYYLYVELDDEDGKYYPVEDIFLVQAKESERYVGNETKKVKYLSTDINWLIEDETTQKEEQSNKTEDGTQAKGKLPQAGAFYMGIFIPISIIAIGALAYKCNKYKGI